MTMRCYMCYGLCLQSEIPLPELAPVEQPPDVTIRLGHLAQVPHNNGPSGRCGDQEEYCLVAEVGDFLVQYGRHIIVEPLPDVDEALLRHYLLNRIMAILLRQRGILVLHASAVAVQNRAIAFVGASGRGKSTIAAAFVAQGYAALTDDYTAIAMQDGGCAVLPGVPLLRLSHASATVLGDEADGFPPCLPADQKCAYALAPQPWSAVFRLTRVYLLTEGHALTLEAVAPQTVFRELLMHSRVRPLRLTSAAKSRHFIQCMQLANAVPIHRLVRPSALARLPELVRLVEQHVAGEA
jgi:hypothetical protein